MLLEDLNRESFKYLRHMCKLEVESYDQLIAGFSQKILEVRDEDLKAFKQKILNQKHQQEVMSTLLNTYLSDEFVRSKATKLLAKLKKEEENSK
jgi:glutamyl-tRNA reductase